LRISRHAGPLFHGMPSRCFIARPAGSSDRGQPTAVASFSWEGGRRWPKRGCPCARFEKYCGPAENLSNSQIAAAIGSARSIVQECLHLAREAGLVGLCRRKSTRWRCTRVCIDPRHRPRAARLNWLGMCETPARLGVKSLAGLREISTLRYIDVALRGVPEHLIHDSQVVQASDI